jgi:hypothetical protein
VSDAEGVDGPVARWVPDELLVASVMGSPRAFRGMTELPGADRAWLVAGLTLSGLTAADIASRLSCSLRLVKSIRAEDMTAVSVWAQRQVQVLSDQVRAEQVAHAASRQELGRVRVEAERLRRQVEDLVKALSRGVVVDRFVGCGHPKVDWNLYLHKGFDRKGRECVREFCRECGRDRAAKYRSRRKSAVQGRRSHAACDDSVGLTN